MLIVGSAIGTSSSSAGSGSAGSSAATRRAEGKVPRADSKSSPSKLTIYKRDWEMEWEVTGEGTKNILSCLI